MAIGAFVAGVMFADTDFGNRLVGETIAFRHIFVSLFFVSIGLLFDLRFAASHSVTIALVVGLVLLVNCVVTALVILFFSYSLRVALATGIILAQIGEFSFLLLDAARNTGGIDPFFYNVLLSSTFITMFLTPLLFSLLPLLLQLSQRIPLFGIAAGARTGQRGDFLSGNEGARYSVRFWPSGNGPCPGIPG